MEYQYYEFQAIDRHLTKAEQEYVQSLSSRVRPTATRAVFTYSYADFPGRPLSVLEKCFDAMLYMANWGSYQLAFRFPKSAVNIQVLESYCVQGVIEDYIFGCCGNLNHTLNTVRLQYLDIDC